MIFVPNSVTHSDFIGIRHTISTAMSKWWTHKENFLQRQNVAANISKSYIKVDSAGNCNWNLQFTECTIIGGQYRDHTYNPFSIPKKLGSVANVNTKCHTFIYLLRHSSRQILHLIVESIQIHDLHVRYTRCHRACTKAYKMRPVRPTGYQVCSQ